MARFATVGIRRGTMLSVGLAKKKVNRWKDLVLVLITFSSVSIALIFLIV